MLTGEGRTQPIRRSQQPPEQGSQNSEVWICFSKGKEIWILDVIYLNIFLECFLLFTSSLTIVWFCTSQFLKVSRCNNFNSSLYREKLIHSNKSLQTFILHVVLKLFLFLLSFASQANGKERFTGFIFTGSYLYHFFLPNRSVATGNKGNCYCLTSAELTFSPLLAFMTLCKYQPS